MMKKYCLLSFFLFIYIFVNAQTTGSFQQNITFTEPDYNFNRTLYFHVPTDYDDTKSYKLVVGFRGGPHSNAGQFRDQLTFLSDSLEAIVLCPENEGHFWNEEGRTKELFRYSLDTTLSMYNIDTNFIYLTGLSYGGRHAIIVSMDTDDGTIPNLRGVIPFAAGSDSQFVPNYTDIVDFPPACICIGGNDNANFTNVSNTLHNDIQSNGGQSILNEIPGVGHTVNFPTYPDEMMECFNFIENQYSVTSDINLSANSDQIVITPNPASNFINIIYTDDLNPEKIYLLNESGKIIRQLKINDHFLNIASLSNGIKTIVFVTKDRIMTKRFVVTK